MLYVFNFSFYASVTLQNLGVCKAFGYCCRLKRVLLQKYTISATLLCSLVCPLLFSIQLTLNLFLQPNKDTVAYMMLGKSIQNVAVFSFSGFMQLVTFR